MSDKAQCCTSKLISDSHSSRIVHRAALCHGSCAEPITEAELHPAQSPVRALLRHLVTRSAAAHPSVIGGGHP